MDEPEDRFAELKHFIIGIIVMVLFILFAIWIAGNGWNPDTGDSGPAGNCIAGTDSGAGC